MVISAKSSTAHLCHAAGPGLIFPQVEPAKAKPHRRVKTLCGVAAPPGPVEALRNLASEFVNESISIALSRAHEDAEKPEPVGYYCKVRNAVQT